jgi:hypothetical protein
MVIVYPDIMVSGAFNDHPFKEFMESHGGPILIFIDYLQHDADSVDIIGVDPVIPLSQIKKISELMAVTLIIPEEDTTLIKVQ